MASSQDIGAHGTAARRSRAMSSRPGEAIKVAVRVRPFSSREVQLGSKCVISMSCADTTVLTNPSKTFVYDYSYWSHDPTSSNFATQERIMSDIGNTIVDNALHGFNGCLFAYGQTGSGKSYSILGYVDSPGIIPRTVDCIFNEKQAMEKCPQHQMIVRVSYLEIYNEHLRDLLQAGDVSQQLKVFDHPKLGVYIPGLTDQIVEEPDAVNRLMDYGTKRRVVSATQMNASSSRSHAVFRMSLEVLEGARPREGEQDTRSALSAKINLVDLAGSERQSKTGTQGQNFKEGCAINQSLSALGMVIKDLSELAEKHVEDTKTVSFRTSKLTFLLKDSLAGNSKTFMMAAISPSQDNLEETLSTLRFASSVKKIKLVAQQNKDSKDALIDELKKELQTLKAQIAQGGSNPFSMSVSGFLLADKHDLMEQMQDHLDYHVADHAQLLDHATKMDAEREQRLQEMSLNSFEATADVPYLLNMADDPTLAGCLLYYLPEGKRTSFGAGAENTVKLVGIGISDALCEIENPDNQAPILRKCGPDGRVVVDGRKAAEGATVKLCHLQKIYFGRAFAMKLIVPLHAHHDTNDHDLLLEGLEDEMAAIAESPSWQNLQDYLNQVLHQMPHDQGQRLWNDVKLAVKVCEEANDITSEIRSDEGLTYEVDLTSAVPATVVIRVLRVASQKSSQATADEAMEPLYVWSLQRMQERLDRMRDSYHQHVSTGSISINVLCDPWHEAHPADILSLIKDYEMRLDELQNENCYLKHKKQRAVGRTMLLLQGDRSRTAERVCFTAWAQLAKAGKRRRDSMVSAEKRMSIDYTRPAKPAPVSSRQIASSKPRSGDSTGSRPRGAKTTQRSGSIAKRTGSSTPAIAQPWKCAHEVCVSEITPEPKEKVGRVTSPRVLAGPSTSVMPTHSQTSREGGFDGCWTDENRAGEAITVIQGETILWNTGASSKLEIVGASRFSTLLNGVVYEATLDGDDKLRWDFGGVWIRDRKLDAEVCDANTLNSTTWQQKTLSDEFAVDPEWTAVTAQKFLTDAVPPAAPSPDAVLSPIPARIVTSPLRARCQNLTSPRLPSEMASLRRQLQDAWNLCGVLQQQLHEAEVHVPQGLPAELPTYRPLLTVASDLSRTTTPRLANLSPKGTLVHANNITDVAVTRLQTAPLPPHGFTDAFHHHAASSQDLRTPRTCVSPRTPAPGFACPGGAFWIHSGAASVSVPAGISLLSGSGRSPPVASFHPEFRVEPRSELAGTTAGGCLAEPLAMPLVPLRTHSRGSAAQRQLLSPDRRLVT